MAECRFLLEKTQEPSDLLEDSPSGNAFLGEENGGKPRYPSWEQFEASKVKPRSVSIPAGWL